MRSHYYKLAKAAALAVGAAVAATFSFQIRELAAAFFVCALLFGGAATVLVGLVLVQERLCGSWRRLKGDGPASECDILALQVDISPGNRKAE
jgi:hypothetical protein